MMKTTFTRLAIALALCGAFVGGMFTTSLARAESRHEEAVEHPRIAKAIHEMEDAVAYLEAAPHDFGGHKGAAIRDTKAAIEQLRLALAYRAAVDTRHGK